MSKADKYKYDVIRHAIRTEFAQGNLCGKAGDRVAAALEAVRGKTEDELKTLATSYAKVRANVRAQTGSNGETPPAS